MLTFLGVMIILATGLYTLYRESKLSSLGLKHLPDVTAIIHKALLDQSFNRRIQPVHVRNLWYPTIFGAFERFKAAN